MSKYFFKDENSGKLISVEERFFGIYRSLISNYPNAEDIIKSFISDYCDISMDYETVFDENGNAVNFDKLNSKERLECLEELDKCCSVCIETAKRYYSSDIYCRD